MGRRHLLYLLYTSSVRQPSPTPYFPAPPPPQPFLIRKNGYSQESSKGNHADDIINHDKAPSTLEEFKRLEEAKASQGFASQTVEKLHDGAMEAVTGEGSQESVKESFKEPVGVGNFHKTGDE